MKKIKDSSIEEFKSIVNRSKSLREKLESYISDVEMDFIREKMSFIEPSLSDYSIGFYNPNFWKIDSYEMFVDGVEQFNNYYGLTVRCEKLLAQCEKLRESNLFLYHAKKLADMFWETEIQSLVDFVEDCCYELYCGKVGEKTEQYLGCFFDNYTDYLYDEEAGMIYVPEELSA